MLFFLNYITRTSETSCARKSESRPRFTRLLGFSLSVLGYFEHEVHEKHRNPHAEKNSNL